MSRNFDFTLSRRPADSSTKWTKSIRIALLLLNVLLLLSFVYFLTVTSGLSQLIIRYVHSPSRLEQLREQADDNCTSVVTVVTEKTKYHGLLVNIFDKSVSVFLGIPYAVPPIGRLRFRGPVAPVTSPRDVDATKYAPKCLQIAKKVPIFTDLTSSESEDCLYLNIWTPFAPSSSGMLQIAPEQRKSVMIWFHGGGFFKGTSSIDQTDARVLASLGDVVVVSFQYRLGPFGFIDLHSRLENGNQGLRDQLAVMKFVKEKIHHWGGDSESITLFGESSGAIAISLHMISPISSKYFSRAILQSGSAFMTDKFYERSAQSTPEFVRLLDCAVRSNETSPETEGDEDDDREQVLEDEYDDYDEIEYDIECLKRVSPEKILNVSQVLHSKYFFAFHPTFGDDLIPRRPSQVAKSPLHERNDTFRHIKQVLLGTNVNAFSYMLYLANDKIFARSGVRDNFTSIDSIADLMRGPLSNLLQMSSFQIEFITDKLMSNVRNATDSKVLLSELIQVLGDMSFVCPMNQLADELASLSKDVYSYLYTHICKSHSPWSQWFGSTLHDEVAFIFGYPLRHPHKYSGVDVDLSKRLISMWTQFARTGSVSSPDDSVEWLKYTQNDTFYMQINSNSVQLKSNLSVTNCDSFKLAFDLLI